MENSVSWAKIFLVHFGGTYFLHSSSSNIYLLIYLPKYHSKYARKIKQGFFLLHHIAGTIKKIRERKHQHSFFFLYQTFWTTSGSSTGFRSFCVPFKIFAFGIGGKFRNMLLSMNKKKKFQDKFFAYFIIIFDTFLDDNRTRYCKNTIFFLLVNLIYQGGISKVNTFN